MNAIPENWQARPVQKVKHAEAITTLSRTHIYDEVKKGNLELIKLGERSSAITTASIVRFLKARGVEFA